jgi:transposase
VSAPSYEQLAALVAAQERIIAQLQARLAVRDARLAAQDARIVEQDARIAELERRLAACSRNSSKPPSGDGLDKPAPKSLRGRLGRKPGGQPRREGRTLRQLAVPDEVVVHEPGACAGCGAELATEGAPAGVIRRQVFDIPQITVRVVEHRLVSRRCSCGVVTAAAGPAGVSAPVSYGPHARRSRCTRCWPAPAGGAHRRAAGRAVRHPDGGRHGGRLDGPGRGRAGAVHRRRPHRVGRGRAGACR